LVLLIYGILPAQNSWLFQNPKPVSFNGDVQFITADIGFAAGGSIINKTTDGGKNWIEPKLEFNR
jgi:photosystem II stability/assembly factor-like uncharacterized protein